MRKKSIMEFNEGKAKEIIEKFNLDEKTIRVWKTRNSIPDKYAKMEGPKVKIAGENDLQTQRNIIKILFREDSSKINVSSIARLANVNSQRLADIVRGKSDVLTTDELLALKKAINILRIEAKEILDDLSKVKYEVPQKVEKKFRDFFYRKEILSKRFFNDDIYVRVEGFARKARSFPIEDIDSIRDDFALFVIETNIC